MGFLSASRIAEKWGVSERSVRNYCAQGRVPGAFLTGKTWNIPEDAAKPGRLNSRMGKASPLLERLRDEKASRVSGGIYHKVQVELTYNSNRIEGSRLSLDQTRLIFETSSVGIEGEPVRVDDIVETANHFRAIDYVLDNAERPITQGMLKELHGILKSSTSDASKDWFAVGDYKRVPNEVGGCETTPPEEVAGEIERLLKSYGTSLRQGFDDIVDFHVAFERIHPFQDGSGRVGRLVMFKECLRCGVVPFIIYDDMKELYYRGLKEWDREKGYLTDTCLAAQDRFKAMLDYFRVSY